MQFNQPIWTGFDEAALNELVQATQSEDLGRALFAVEGAAPETIKGQTEEINAWGQALSGRVAEDASPRMQAIALSEFFETELGFKSERTDQNNPKNAFLSATIRRREGLPALQGALWKLVGAHAGIQVDALAMPYLFILRVGGENGVLVDPVEGHVITPMDCKAQLETLSNGKIPWQDEFLESGNFRDWVERVLKTLMGSFVFTGSVAILYRALRFAAALHPDSAHYQVANARLAEGLGQTAIAVGLYSGILEHFEGSAEAEFAMERIAELSHQDHLVN